MLLMITTRDILMGVLLPAVVSGVIVVIGRLVGGGAMRAAPSLAVGLGFVAGHTALFGVPGVPPVSAVEWLFYIAAILGAIGALDAWLLRREPGDPTQDHNRSRGDVLEYADVRLAPRATSFQSFSRALSVLVVSLLSIWLLTRPLLRNSWTGVSGPVHILVIAAIAWITWMSLDRLSQRADMLSLHITLTLLAALAAGVFALSASLRLGQLGGMFAAALGAVAVLSWGTHSRYSIAGVALVFSLLYVVLITAASNRAYAELTDLHASLLLSGPLCAWAGEVIPHPRPAWRGCVRIVAALLPAALAATLAGIDFARAASEYSEYGY